MTTRKRLYKMGATNNFDNEARAEMEAVFFVTTRAIGPQSLWEEANVELIRVEMGEHAIDHMATYRVIIEADAEAFSPNVRNDRIGLNEDWNKTLKGLA